MSDRLFERSLRDWLEAGSDQTPPPVIDAVLLAVRTTPQERDLRIRRSLNVVPGYTRLAALIALLAIVGTAGVGGLMLFSNVPVDDRDPTATPIPTPRDTSAPTLGPTEVPPGITGWTTYTSAVYGTALRYPSDWSVRGPATRNYGEDGDAFPGESLPYADTFVSPGGTDTEIGLVVWQMHIDVFFGAEDLTSLADKFCRQVVASSCETFTRQAVPLDFNNGGDGGCAVLVPTADHQFAFLSDRSSCLVTEATSWITVVVITGEDELPSAVRYGGSVELLKSIVATMSVWRPGERPGT